MVPTTASWDGLRGSLFAIGGLTVQFRQALNLQSSWPPECWDYRPAPPCPIPHWALTFAFFCLYFSNFMCMGIFPVYMSVHNTLAWCPWNSEEGVRSPGTEVTNGCKPPCECWQLNVDLPPKPQVLLTAGSSPQQPPFPAISHVLLQLTFLLATHGYLGT